MFWGPALGLFYYSFPGQDMPAAGGFLAAQGPLLSRELVALPPGTALSQ